MYLLSLFKKLFKNNKFVEILSFAVLFLLSLLPTIALFHSGLPITHDGQDHVARIANFYLNLTQGNWFPVWAPNLNWGYGHPILEFLYPLPSYIASIFHFIGFSLVDSTKIVFGLGMVLSFFFMYLWLSQFVSKYAAIFGAMLYLYAPYRFVETYVRGDIGENLAFAFIPLVLFFIYKLQGKEKYKFVIGGSLALSLLILAHNAISLMLMPFILAYSLFLVYLSKNRKQLSLNLILLIAGGFALSAFFWIPALIEGKYTLRNIVTAGGYLGRFINLQSIIYGPWSYGGSGQFTVQYGIFQWLAIIFSPILIIIKRKEKEKCLLTGILLFFVIASTFLMFKESNFIWSKFILLQNFQFPWRFLAIVVFTTATLGSLVFDLIPKKISLIFLLIVISLILFIGSFYSQANGYQYKPVGFYSGIYNSTTDTGESAPIWSVRFMEHRAKAPAEVIEGAGRIKEVIHLATYQEYEFDSLTSARILINTLYFPNWSVYIEGKKTQILFQDPQYRGLMTFYTTPGNHKVEVKLEDTKLRIAAKFVSLISFVIIIIFLTFRKLKIKV
jgi:uncharacterized membrane protein